MVISVRVKPNSKNPRIETAADGSLTAYLKAPPVEGRANDELIARLAGKFGVPKSHVRLRSGQTARSKLVEIGG